VSRAGARSIKAPAACAMSFRTILGGVNYFCRAADLIVAAHHLFQIVALLAMEPPTYRGFEAVHGETADVLRAMRPLVAGDVVRGQYAGYRQEPGVAKHSDVETFCALRLFIDSWRGERVPWYLRSGKCLAETAAEVIVDLKPPPQRLFADSAPGAGLANYLRGTGRQHGGPLS
jgi:glucose-6-phosphate 1-dehydrogenase